MFPRLLVILMLVPLALEAARECRDDLNEADGYTIRSVKVEGRWAPQIALPINPGDRFTNAKVQDAMRAVQEALNSSDERAQFELQNLGAVGVVHITRCLLVDGRQVDVIIEARSVRIDLFEVGGNVLPIPRSPFATFYDAVPPPILALNPRLGLYQDKAYGFAPTGAIAGDLLHLTKPAASINVSHLDLALSGRKSVDEAFYDVDVSLALNRVRPGEFIDKISWSGAFVASDEPRADHSLQHRAGEFGGMLRFKPDSSFLQSLYVGANYRYATNNFSADRDRTSEHAVNLRLLGEGRGGGGFIRGALWAGAAFPDRASDYGRVAGMFAFEREFLVAPNQTIGIEATVGGGHAWSAPEYARFYGGNSFRNFLYDSAESRALTDFPTGPLIRSIGEASAVADRGEVTGANSYWHVNLNVTLPIPSLSFPLIPNEEVAPGLSLKRLLKNKAGDSVAFYAAELEAEGHSPDEALAMAKKTYSEVRPAIDYIADRANVWALKPLLMCDVAGQDSGSSGQRVQAALGAGIQLTIVTAKFELGYMHTVAGDDNGSGNLFGRIVFENIF
ncbi:MAG: hypothetical protein ACJ8HQ_11525 [Chthoniobacterales bacterium]